MPDEHLSNGVHAGFYGKLPSAGDFVSRGLPADFVRAWDRWTARHLVPLMVSGDWPQEIPLFFLGGVGMPRPMAGVVLSSEDRAGRLFPLTLAVEIGHTDTKLLLPSAEWFETLRALGERSSSGELDVTGLEAALAALPQPGTEPNGEPDAFYLGTRADEVLEVDPKDPESVLRTLLEAASPHLPATRTA